MLEMPIHTNFCVFWGFVHLDGMQYQSVSQNGHNFSSGVLIILVSV